MASQGRGSRSKGSGFELKVAKLLSEWWGGTFSRVPASGGLHWGSDQRVAGDIIAPPEIEFPFVVECKKHEGFTIENVFLNTGTPKDWWKQVVTDARRVKLTPILFFSRNRAKIFVMMPYDDTVWKFLNAIAGVTQPHGLMRTKMSFTDIRGDEQEFDVLVTTYDSFSALSTAFLKEKGKDMQTTWDFYADLYK